MVAAFYVQTGGAYYGLPDVDPWAPVSARLLHRRRRPSSRRSC